MSIAWCAFQDNGYEGTALLGVYASPEAAMRDNPAPEFRPEGWQLRQVGNAIWYEVHDLQIERWEIVE